MNASDLLDRVAAHVAYEVMLGRAHTWSANVVTSPHGTLVAIAIDEDLVVRTQAPQLYRAIDQACVEFAEYAALVGDLDRSVRAVRGRAAGNTNDAAVPR